MHPSHRFLCVMVGVFMPAEPWLCAQSSELSLPAPSDGGAQVALAIFSPLASEHTCGKKKKALSISHIVGFSAVRSASKHWCERWEVNTACLWFTLKMRAVHAVLIITTWSDFSHNSLAPDGSNFSASREGDCVERFGNPGVVLVLRYSNWLWALERFSPTEPSDWSSPGLYTVSQGNLFSNLFPASV